MGRGTLGFLLSLEVLCLALLAVVASREDGAGEPLDDLLNPPLSVDGDGLAARFARAKAGFRAAVAGKDASAVHRCLEEFRAVAAGAEGSGSRASLRSWARIGEADCLLELGDARGAKRVFEELTERVGLENAVNAAAFNGLGECWYRQDAFTEALRCFLRVQLIYADGASPDAVAKAIYFTGDCFARLGDRRARQELTGCIERFPKSPWTAKALKLRANLPK